MDHAAQVAVLSSSLHKHCCCYCCCGLSMSYHILHNISMCITLCSGSRGIGNQTAQHHDKIAADWLGRSGISTPTGLNYMQIESNEGQAYLGVKYI